MFTYAFSAEDLFIDLQDKYLKTKIITQQIKLQKINRRIYAARLFKECLYEILLDIIENNVTFVLPLYSGNYAEIYAETLDEELFKTLYKKGSCQNIDYVQSQFSVNRLMFLYKTSKGMRKRPIHLLKELNKLLTKYTNEGKRYC